MKTSRSFNLFLATVLVSIHPWSALAGIPAEQSPAAQQDSKTPVTGLNQKQPGSASQSASVNPLQAAPLSKVKTQAREVKLKDPLVVSQNITITREDGTQEIQASVTFQASSPTLVKASHYEADGKRLKQYIEIDLSSTIFDAKGLIKSGSFSFKVWASSSKQILKMDGKVQYQNAKPALVKMRTYQADGVTIKEEIETSDIEIDDRTNSDLFKSSLILNLQAAGLLSSDRVRVKNGSDPVKTMTCAQGTCKVTLPLTNPES